MRTLALVLLLWPFLWLIIRLMYPRLFLSSWPGKELIARFLLVSLLSAVLGTIHFLTLFSGVLSIALISLVLWAVTIGWIVPKWDNRRMIKMGFYDEEVSSGKFEELAGVGLLTLFISYFLGFLISGLFFAGV
ncbi:hypothetical protein E3E28_02815 [Thermococcus sp. 21S9]|nr:hypothetical protein [Thermococcus sp. 21S9]